MAAPDALKRYHDKRDFSVTPEPREGGDAATDALSFVIQKHWASHLHYDFRLELDGTMKSWAVPKGPSLDQKVKRMAVEVEDHPIAYSQFEGEIPAKQYGAGSVIIWDRGTWTPLGDPHAGYRDGNLKFRLDGEKLQGNWALIRMKGKGEKQPPWLLIKEKDAHVRPESEYIVTDALPDSVGKAPAAKPAKPSKPSTTAKAAKAAKGATAANTPKSAKAPSAQKTTPTATTSVALEAPPNRKAARTAAGAAPATEKTGVAAKSATKRSKPFSIKQLPAGAVKATLPESLSPELATLVASPPENAEDWLYEIKFDGYRLLARIEAGAIRLITRNGNDWTERMPQLVRALAAMKLPDCWLDGEIVVMNEAGVPDFQALQNAFDGAVTQAITYHAFDLPYLAGHDLRSVPVEERRAMLESLIDASDQGPVRFSNTFDAPVAALLESSCKLGMEGVIGKRRGSPYVMRRSADWIKIKCGQRQEFVIGGYTAPKGNRAGFGSLLLGVHDAAGHLQYAGNVGTGFNDATLATIHAQLEALDAAASPFAGKTGLERSAHWVKPTLVAEVAFAGWTGSARLRHAVFQGLRIDKPARGILREQAVSVAAASPAAPASGIKLPATLKISHGDKIIDATTGTRKIDVIEFYAQVAPLMMPHLAARPVALVRAPDGVGGTLFFQKHAEATAMAGISLLDPALDPGHAPLLAVSAAQGLLAAGQMNVIEFHTWNAKKDVIAKPDRMTFDLDPGEGVGWAQVQESAELVRALLTQLGLPAFLKTSGGKGLHVVVPIKRLHGWDAVKDFSHAIVDHLAATIPQRFVARSGPANRVGKIFADYLRNGFGATTACAWSARARPGLGVSVPVAWSELATLSGGAHWTLATIGPRLPVGNMPWADYDGAAIGLGAAMKKLGFTPSA